MRWTDEGLQWEADPKHRKIVMEAFGFDEKSKMSKVSGDK